MSEAKDIYRTIAKASQEVLLKEKKSKFYGYAFPVNQEIEIKPIIDELRKQFPNANHVCYAYQIGVENTVYRVHDDGEPNNSAGLPIYGQIQSFELTNVLIAVIRVFGGTKLGIGGLISAYKNTAKLALENTKTITKTIKEKITLKFEYAEMDMVMRLIKKHQLTLISQKLDLKCEVLIEIRKNDVRKTIQLFKAFHKIEVTEGQ